MALRKGIYTITNVAWDNPVYLPNDDDRGDLLGKVPFPGRDITKEEQWELEPSTRQRYVIKNVQYNRYASVKFQPESGSPVFNTKAAFTWQIAPNNYGQDFYSILVPSTNLSWALVDEHEDTPVELRNASSTQSQCLWKIIPFPRPSSHESTEKISVLFNLIEMQGALRNSKPRLLQVEFCIQDQYFRTAMSSNSANQPLTWREPLHLRSVNAAADLVAVLYSHATFEANGISGGNLIAEGRVLMRDFMANLGTKEIVLQGASNEIDGSGIVLRVSYARLNGSDRRTAGASSVIAAQNRPTSTNISQLPYDIIFRILTRLRAADIVRLLSSCRDLHSLMSDERIWRSLCAQYGIRDATFNGHRSFYSVYAKLLHPYGYLIGLWAGDHPVTGHLIEFRLEWGSKGETGFIVGEVWLTEPYAANPLESPKNPQYVRALQIGFSDHIPARHGRNAATTQSDQVVVSCCSQNVGFGGWHPTSLLMMGETSQSIFLSSIYGTFRHPDFPDGQSSVWKDAHRALPQSCPPPVANQIGPVPFAYGAPTPTFVTAPTENIKPIALSVACSYNCLQAHLPPPRFPYAVNISSLPRYYPLRSEISIGIDPSSRQWNPATLTGLWLGNYNVHGTEYVFVHWDSESQILCGIKITGDEYVPRGVTTWEVDTSFALPPRLDTHTMVFPQPGRDQSPYRVFRGTIALSVGVGYLPPQRRQDAIALAVVAPNKLHVTSLDQAVPFVTYVRYTGRQNRTPR